MNYQQMNNNKVVISGVVTSEPEFSHEVYGEKFYDTCLKVDRLSGNPDMIPVTISERIIESENIAVGKRLSGYGQFRSYNKVEADKSKLILTVFLREVDNAIDQNTNSIELTGYICKTPIYRTTPFKREICDVLIAVNRSYNKSDYLPCIAWGRNAKYLKEFLVGEKVKFNGRIQSRAYQKKFENGEVEDKVAYEISISRVTRESAEIVKEINIIDMQNVSYMQNHNNY